MSKFFYTEEEDYIKEESINNYKEIFFPYMLKYPSLEEALEHLYKNADVPSEKIKDYVKDIIDTCTKTLQQEDRKKQINKEYPNLTDEECKIICAYTCESSFGKKYSVYRILNTNMVNDNRKAGLSNVSKYLYILLTTLRKLKKYEIKQKSDFLYRCIPIQVKLINPNNKNWVAYKKGNTKTFWCFTSTSYDIDTATQFLGNDYLTEKTIKTGTIFSISGKAWGYDISLFNKYYPKEKEVLIEPERKYYIDEIIDQNGLIYIRCEIIDSPIVLKDIPNLKNYEKYLTQLGRYFDGDIIIKYKKEYGAKTKLDFNNIIIGKSHTPLEQLKKVVSNYNIKENFDEVLDDIYILLLEIGIRIITVSPSLKKEIQENKIPIKYEYYGIKEEMFVKSGLKYIEDKDLFDIFDTKIILLINLERKCDPKIIIDKMLKIVELLSIINSVNTSELKNNTYFLFFNIFRYFYKSIFLLYIYLNYTTNKEIYKEKYESEYLFYKMSILINKNKLANYGHRIRGHRIQNLSFASYFYKNLQKEKYEFYSDENKNYEFCTNIKGKKCIKFLFERENDLYSDYNKIIKNKDGANEESYEVYLTKSRSKINEIQEMPESKRPYYEPIFKIPDNFENKSRRNYYILLVNESKKHQILYIIFKELYKGLYKEFKYYDLNRLYDFYDGYISFAFENLLKMAGYIIDFQNIDNNQRNNILFDINYFY